MQQLRPEYIIHTHEHFDHIWGVNKLKETFACKIICSTGCADKIIDRKGNMSVFYDQVGFQSTPADILLENLNYKLVWADKDFEFIESKGHTDGCACVFVDNKLFTGDTIIKNHKIVVKLPRGSRVKLKVSLDYIFLNYSGKEVMVYPGHGECFPLREVASKKLI